MKHYPFLLILLILWLSLSFQSVLVAQETNPAAVPIAYGEEIETILIPGEDHSYTFEGSAGDRVTISTTVRSGTADLKLRLFRPDGRLLFEDEDSATDGNPFIPELPLPDSGTYRILVTRCNNCDLETTALYVISVTVPATPTPTPTRRPTVTPQPTETAQPMSARGQVSLSTGTPLLACAGIDCEVIGDVPQSEVFSIIASQHNYYEIRRDNGETGFVRAALIRIARATSTPTPFPTNTPPPTARPEIPGRVNSSSLVNVRDCSSLDCAIVGTTNSSETFMIHALENGWYQVTLKNGQPGYIFADFVSVVEDFADATIPITTPVPPTPDPVQLANSTATASALGPMIGPKNDGTHRVGVDIYPGDWESNPGFDYCRWQRRDAQGGLLGDYTGNSGGVIRILPTDYEVSFRECGLFFYVDPNLPLTLRADAAEDKPEGIYRVGVEIVPGLWRISTTDDDCYYARYAGSQEIIDNGFILGEANLVIQPSDFEVEFSRCTNAHYVGPA